MLRKRLITASILMPILVAVNWAGDPFFSALAGLVSIYATYEFCQLTQRAGFRPVLPVAVALAIAFVGVIAVAAGPAEILGALTVAAVVAAVWLLIRGDPLNAAADWALTLAIPFYTGLLLAHFILLRQRPLGAEWVLFTFFVTWVTDAVAFFVGRAHGTRKLAPAFSPKKTIEGALGGFAGAVLTAVPLIVLLGLPFSLGQAVFVGALIGIAAQAGDLVESAFKRSLQAEDAGQIFPGHGGLLDRMDSLVFAAVVMYYIS